MPLDASYRHASLPLQAIAGQREGVRRVAFAYESVNAAAQMISWAITYCLFPDDEISLLHCISKVGGPAHTLAFSRIDIVRSSNHN